MLNCNLLESLLKNDVSIIIKDETVSTNTDGKELAKNGLSRPTLIVANRQNGGRGRQGKSFLSPAGGLYMTLVLPVNIPLSQATCATSCAAVAVCRGIEKTCGEYCGIKWINDIYLRNRKLSGILTESINDYEAMVSKYLIIGIGVNIDSTPEITDSSVKAISLADVGYYVEREILCANITAEILLALDKKFDFSAYRDEYKSRCILLGKEIVFTENGISKIATAEDITDRGALIAVCDGKSVLLDSGEISVRSKE